MTPKYDIYLTDEGFFVGRRLKNGKMAAGSRRITDEEIMTMFTHLYQNYVKQTGTDKMLMQTSDGTSLCTFRLKFERKN